MLLHTFVIYLVVSFCSYAAPSPCTPVVRYLARYVVMCVRYLCM